MQFILSNHALKRIQQRKIKHEWILATLESPDTTESDADDPELCHAIKAIPEKGFKKLRVIYKETVDPWVIITAFIE